MNRREMKSFMEFYREEGPGCDGPDILTPEQASAWEAWARWAETEETARRTLAAAQSRAEEARRANEAAERELESVAAMCRAVTSVFNSTTKSVYDAFCTEED